MEMQYKTIKLTEQELDDLASCINFTLKDYPKEGSTNFLRALKRLKKRIWKVIRSEEICIRIHQEETTDNSNHSIP